jgi:hypothetical protein
MTTRAGNMADIDTYIADSQVTDVPPVMLPVDAPTDAVGAPTVETDHTGAKIAPKPEDHDEQAVPQDADTGRASIREMERTQLEQAQQRQNESAAAQAIRQGVQGVTDNTQRINNTLRAALSKTSATIGAVPIPGDLITPLAVLLIFFFALVVINGHTRLSWLWLVLSGNASITTDGGATFGQNTPAPVVGTPLSTPLAPLPGLPTPPIATGGLLPLTIVPFAGVGEVT